MRLNTLLISFKHAFTLFDTLLHIAITLKYAKIHIYTLKCANSYEEYI